MGQCKKMPFDQRTLAWREGHEGQVHRRTSEAYEIECRAQDSSKGNREQSRSSTYNTAKPACEKSVYWWEASAEIAVEG